MSLPQEVINQGQEIVSHSSILPIAGTLAGGGGLLSAGKCIQTIPKGYVGLRTRFRNPSFVEQREDNEEEVETNLRKFLTPGRWPRFHAPFTHGIVTISVQDRPTIVEMEVDCDDDEKQRSVQAQIKWGVKPDSVSAYRALYHPQGDEKGNPDETKLVAAVEGELAGGFYHVMKRLKVGERTDDNVREELIGFCAEGLAWYGSEIRRVNLIQDARTLGQFLLEARGIVTPDEAATFGQQLPFRVVKPSS